MYKYLLIIAIILSAMSVNAAFAAESPTTAPVAERYVATVPDGFERVEADGHVVFCRPADVAWVAESLKEIQLKAPPSTMPTDLLTRLDQHGAEMAALLKDQLLIEDMAGTDRLRSDLRQAIVEFNEFHPPIFYLLATADELRDALKNGWTNPRYHYNRLSNTASFDMNIPLRLEGEMDDTVIPAIHPPDADQEVKRQSLTQAIDYTTGFVQVEVSNRAQVVAQVVVAAFIEQQLDQHFEPKEDQVWFRLGVTGVLSSQALALINGMPAGQVMDAISREPQRTPVKADRIDLLHPVSVRDLRPEYVQPHIDAMRRRSVSAVRQWLQNQPDGLRQTLSAIRQNPPEDGLALVALILKVSGYDIAPLLQKRG